MPNHTESWPKAGEVENSAFAESNQCVSEQRSNHSVALPAKRSDPSTLHNGLYGGDVSSLLIVVPDGG
jgi:hypothetical protein